MREREELPMETVRERTLVDPKPKEPRNKLTGAAKEGLRWLVVNGHAVEEARKLALTPSLSKE